MIEPSPPRSDSIRCTGGARAVPLAFLRLTLALALLAAGCREQSASRLEKVETHPSTGEMTVELAGESRQFPLADAECRTRASDGRDRLEVRVRDPVEYRDFKGNTVRFDRLTATLPAPIGADGTEFGTDGATTSRLGAIASLPEIEWKERRYAMLQLVARHVEHPQFDFRCRVVRNERIELTCEGARPFPWRSAGAVPSASFEAKFQCRDESAPG